MNLRTSDDDVILEHAGYVARGEAKTEVEAALAAINRTWRRRAWIAGGVLLIAIAGGGVALATRGKHTPPARTRATAKCIDGSWSYAVQRQGACAAHGGVKVFYK